MAYRNQQRALQELARILAREDLKPEERAQALAQWREARGAWARSRYRFATGGTQLLKGSALQAGKLRRVRPPEAGQGNG